MSKQRHTHTHTHTLQVVTAAPAEEKNGVLWKGIGRRYGSLLREFFTWRVEFYTYIYTYTYMFIYKSICIHAQPQMGHAVTLTCVRGL